MQYFTQFTPPVLPPFLLVLAPFILIIVLWTIVIKGYALWTSAHSNQKWWFIALLVINTVGILEIVYLIWFSPKGSNKFNSHFSHTPAHHSSSQA